MATVTGGLVGRQPEDEAGASLEARTMLSLTRVEGLGVRLIRQLVDRYGSATRAVEAVRAMAPAGTAPPVARMPSAVRERVARLKPVEPGRLRALDRSGVCLATYGSAGYPSRLTDLSDPPPVIYLQGAAPPDLGRCVAIVGTRRANPYGLDMAGRLAAGCVRSGWTVVSGLALGIDAAAHVAALDGGGFTIGVLGSGLDHEYPSANRPLYRRMRRSGLLMSEFDPPVPPSRHSFPRRNRVIAALARAVVVVQAGRRSGALITADHALDLGRDVLAVPGRADWRVSVGVHRLLRDGAGLVTGADDVLAALEWGDVRRRPSPESESGETRSAGEVEGVTGCERTAAGLVEQPAGTRRVLDRLADDECAADDLAAATGLPAGAAHALLGRLELEGRIVSRPGGRFARAPGFRGPDASGWSDGRA